MKDEANLTFSHNLESVSSDGMRFQREKFCPRVERAKKFLGGSIAEARVLDVTGEWPFAVLGGIWAVFAIYSIIQPPSEQS